MQLQLAALFVYDVEPTGQLLQEMSEYDVQEADTYWPGPQNEHGVQT